MTKKQKVWFWIFFAMFIVPEVLWSPVGNYVYVFMKGEFFRNNFLLSSDNRIWLIWTVSIQLVGVVSLLISLLWSKLYKQIKGGELVVFLVGIFNLITIIVFYLLLATYHMWR
ncbi:hypothetical protein D4R52_00695 [bacterium]|nr:MAG: hypothetical protein D4R52_00695 [bacterium]